MKTVKRYHAARKRKQLSKKLVQKELPSHLKYAFSKPKKAKPVIISAALTENEEQC